MKYDWYCHEKGKFGHRDRLAQREVDMKTHKKDAM